jgi:Flp pilus assembly protein TadD
VVICVLLGVVIFDVFGQTLGHGFVNYDDTIYVYENPVVTKGLTLEGVGWAFTHFHGGNWHPLTTISHLLDCQVYGLHAWGHHLTNVLLHAATAVLLFLMLRELTGGWVWRCAFVAMFFAIHPLRVESVAWISERKDVLSGVFFMLTLWAYARYARCAGPRGRWRKLYAMVVLWFLLGLMSKPMLVTTPFVLLLLDYWPLRRLQWASQFPRLLWEKLPLFALAIFSCVATAIAQQRKGAVTPWEYYPFILRMGNALVAYVVYLGKLAYPARLAVLYPLSLDHGSPAWQVVAALLILGALTAGAFLLRRSQPFVWVGWLWYLGMLVPVIGIIQVGSQAYADRYTYLPQIGLYLAGTWAAAEWTGKWRHGRLALGGVAVAALGVLAVASFNQTSYWRDSIILWTHTLACTRDNYTAHHDLGNALLAQGQTAEAVTQYNQALRIRPDDPEAHYGLGNALLAQGQTAEAVTQYNEALRIRPDDPKAHNSLGTALAAQGQTAEAETQFNEALRINPAYADVYNNLGNLLLQLGRTEEAAAEYREALRINPANADVHNNLGNALSQLGRAEEAVAEYREARELDRKELSATNH